MQKQSKKRLGQLLRLMLVAMAWAAAAGIFLPVTAQADSDEYWDDEYDDDEWDEEDEEPIGWEKVGSNWYYYRFDGKKEKGWLLDDEDDEIYYLDSKTGIRQTGWQSIEDKTYFFDKNGRLQTGWQKKKDKTYYLKEKGKLGEIGKAVRGWHVLKGRKFHFTRDGEMNTGKAEIKGDVYYFKKNGEQRTGWIDEENGLRRYYYQQKDSKAKWGELVKGRTFKNHYFSQTGVTSRSIDQCGEILDQIGWNLRAAYDWSAGLSYSGRTTYLEQMGSEKLAQQGFTHHTGNCYVMAATFYEMALCLGYDAHQIAGQVPARRGGLTNHSWVEIDEEDGRWIYDPNCTMETHVDRFHFRYGTPRTWRYTNYHRMN